MSEPQTYQPQGARSEPTVTDTTPRVAPETTAKAQEIGEHIQNEAHRLKEEAKDQGRAMIQDQQHAIADQVGGMASALRSTADQLETQDQSAMAQYTQQAADGLERFSQTLKDRDLNTLVGHVEDFARNQPAAFIGSAALLGFMASRFLKSSAERRAASSYETPNQHSYEAGRMGSPSRVDTASPSTIDRPAVHRSMSPGAETPTSTTVRGDN